MKKQPLMHIEFLDHAQSTHREGPGWDEPVRCAVVGWLVRETKTHYVLSAWISDSILSDDSDAIIIVKHPGMKVKRLSGGKQ